MWLRSEQIVFTKKYRPNPGCSTTIVFVTLVRKFFSKNTVSNHCLSCLSCALTITQAYWDVSRTEAAFTTIQKLFSSLN